MTKEEIIKNIKDTIDFMEGEPELWEVIREQNPNLVHKFSQKLEEIINRRRMNALQATKSLSKINDKIQALDAAIGRMEGYNALNYSRRLIEEMKQDLITKRDTLKAKLETIKLDI